MTSRPSLTTLRVTSLLLGTLLTACTAAGPGAGRPSSSAAKASSSLPTSATASASEISDDKLAPFDCSLPIHGDASEVRSQITNIRLGEHSRYDRIAFTFASGTPEYIIEKAEPPLTHDPSGLAMQVQGASYLRLVLRGGTVQLPDGGRSYDGSTDFAPHFAKLLDVRSAGDFEAVASWYLGLNADACVRAFTLTGPDRLVVDLQH